MQITRRSQLLAGMGAPTPTGVQAIRSLASGASDLALDQITGVTFRSQISPDVQLTAAQATGRAPSKGGVSQLFMQLTKPTVYVDTTLGTIRLAPWGEPSINLYPLLLIGTLVGVGALAGLAYRGLKG